MEVRAEFKSDHDAVRKLHQAAFPTDFEARLVDLLRSTGDATHSIVGIKDTEVIGHAMCSRMIARFPAIALAPVATAEHHRRQGVAEKIINAIIDESTTQGWVGAFVLGDPAYYERFGFSVKLASGFTSPYQGEHFMMRWLGQERPDQMQSEVFHSDVFSTLE